jgi:DNA-binding SARP family transcriptional activator
VLGFHVLGPLEVRGPTEDIAVGGRKQRILLALLLLHADRFVSRADLVDALWPEDPPLGAMQTIESYVSRLRSQLRRAGADGELIVSGPAGYRLSLNGSRLDSEEFERRAVAAREAAERGNAAEALALAKSALSLWRGPALSGLGDQFPAEVGALEERRLAVLEALGAAGLACGRAQEVITWLGPEIARHPAREHLRALSMIALYRLGRQAEALESYRDARRYLVEELGLEPGPELRELQERILHHDPSLLAPPSSDRAQPPTNDLSLPGDNRADRPDRRRSRMLVGVVVVASVALIGAIVWLAIGSGAGPGSPPTRVLRGPAVGLIDAGSGEPRAASAIPTVPTGLVAGANTVWATSYDNGTLMRLDVHNLAVPRPFVWVMALLGWRLPLVMSGWP